MTRQKAAPTVSVMIAAAGSGSRMGAQVNKIFLDLAEAPVLAHTLHAFEHCPLVAEIIIAAAERDIMECGRLSLEYGIGKLKTVVAGGATRQQSVRNALSAVSEGCDIVLVHDAARPLVRESVINGVIAAAAEHGAAAAGAECKNTMKSVDVDGFIVKTLDRSRMTEIQTPQGFLKSIITRAHEDAVGRGIGATDDCMLAELIGAKIKLVHSGSDNLKITTYDDLIYAEHILESRRGE